VSTDPIAPRRLNAQIPRDLENICLKCLEKDPRRRYPSADQLAQDLSRFLRNEPVMARRVSVVTRGWRWCLRNQVTTFLVGTCLALLVYPLIIGLMAIGTTWLATMSLRQELGNDAGFGGAAGIVRNGVGYLNGVVVDRDEDAEDAFQWAQFDATVLRFS
jgi:hypothetical protein